MEYLGVIKVKFSEFSDWKQNRYINMRLKFLRNVIRLNNGVTFTMYKSTPLA